jgi:hypothetical protein
MCEDTEKSERIAKVCAVFFQKKNFFRYIAA